MRHIVDVVMDYLPEAKVTGESGLRSTCPLCESRRSFIVNSDHGGWVCFSCSESGSFSGFLYQVCGMSRKQADRVLSAIPTGPIMGRRGLARRAASVSWGTLPEYILGAYDHTPQSLLDLGFSEDLLRRHDVGIDIPNKRITFAIRDMNGRLVGVSGRAVTKWQIPRYKVYDAEPASGARKAGEFHGVVKDYKPDNRKHLYGFDSIYARRFYRPVQDETPLIITEGYKSTLWLRQMGYTDAVGLQGSSISAMQVRQVGKLRGPYYVMLDNEPGKAYPDRSGRCAALAVAYKLKSYGKVYLCMYEGRCAGTAPDDVKDKEEIKQMIENAKSPASLRAM